MFDVCIIGAGITGSLLARELAKTRTKVLLLEKENDVGCGATMANSAIIHSGWDPEDGTLKARLNLRGSLLYEELCADLGVAYVRTSALVAATSPEEEEILALRAKRARERGIPARLLSREEAVAEEPNLSEFVTAALELPTTAIVSPWEVAIAAAEEAVLNGVRVSLLDEVQRITPNKGESGATYFHIKTSRAEYDATVVVNCAGVYADSIFAMVTTPDDPERFQIIPRRGEYFVLDKVNPPIVTRVIYPVPSAVGKGVLAVPTVDGNLLLGPNAVDIEDKDGVNTTGEGLSQVAARMDRIVKGIPKDRIIRQFAGLRAKCEGGDFRIFDSSRFPGFITAAGIDSPGLSSAPAIAAYILEEYVSSHLALLPKESYQKRTPFIRMERLGSEERRVKIEKEPLFGHMICRCERISEGEIIDAIRRPLGASTILGVKKRARPGMGRCQGGFCEPKVAEILARECGVPLTSVTYDGPSAPLFYGETKNEAGGEAKW